MSNPYYGYGVGGGGGAGNEAAGYSSYEIDLIAARYSGDPPSYPSSTFDAQGGTRRSAEVLYHQSIMGGHSTFGQNEALYSSVTMAKRPRLEGNLPIYPQRPGEQDCAFYMMTRTCKFGDACKFDHPQWVPEGGIPNWQEVPKIEESHPVRAGEPDCPTGKCKFGSRCKFNHPEEKVNAPVGGTGDVESLTADRSVLPVRPSEPLCSFYAKTAKCKFGANCKFNHPKDIEIPSSGKESYNISTIEAAGHVSEADGAVSSNISAPVAAAQPAQDHNSKGLPIRPGEVDCSFYMKTGSCKFGSKCRFNHPERNLPVLNFPLAAPLDQSILSTATTAVPSTVLDPAANFFQSFDFHAAHLPVEAEPVIYPQRPGETVCDFYMKTGYCKYSERCKFHHPVNRAAPDQITETVTLTLAGLPRREEAEVCAFYMKTGSCKFGTDCKFDHPPPGEAIAKVSSKKKGKKGESKGAAGLSDLL